MRRFLISIPVAVSILAVSLAAAPAAVSATSSVAFSPHVLPFGHVQVGSTIEKAVALTNTSSETLTVNGYEVSSTSPTFNGNFTINPGTCRLFEMLAPGEECTFTIVTSPMAVGPLHGQFCYTMVGATIDDRQCGRVVGAAT